MNEPEIKCTICDWEGDSSELVSKTEDLDDNDFNYCPDCGSDKLEDIED